MRPRLYIIILRQHSNYNTLYCMTGVSDIFRYYYYYVSHDRNAFEMLPCRPVFGFTNGIMRNAFLFPFCPVPFIYLFIYYFSLFIPSFYRILHVRGQMSCVSFSACLYKHVRTSSSCVSSTIYYNNNITSASVSCELGRILYNTCTTNRYYYYYHAVGEVLYRIQVQTLEPQTGRRIIVYYFDYYYFFKLHNIIVTTSQQLVNRVSPERHERVLTTYLTPYTTVFSRSRKFQGVFRRMFKLFSFR